MFIVKTIDFVGRIALFYVLLFQVDDWDSYTNPDQHRKSSYQLDWYGNFVRIEFIYGDY